MLEGYMGFSSLIGSQSQSGFSTSKHEDSAGHEGTIGEWYILQMKDMVYHIVKKLEAFSGCVQARALCMQKCQYMSMEHRIPEVSNYG